MIRNLFLLAVIAIFSFGSLNAQTETAIYDIQYTTEAGADNDYPSTMLDQDVTVTGIVSAIRLNTDGDAQIGYFVQDAQGAWNGIYCHDSDNTPAVGDEVTLTGTVSEFYGQTQITPVSSFAVNSSENMPYGSAEISTSDANMEKYESVMVYINGAECTNDNTADNFGMWEINDGSGALLIDDVLYAFQPTSGTTYYVKGVGYYSYSEPKILPRSADDISSSPLSVKDLNKKMSVAPNPVNNMLYISNETAISSVEVINMVGKKVAEYSSINNSKFEMSAAALQSGIYFVKVSDINGDVSISKIMKK